MSRPLPWHRSGVWLHGDIHTHYLLREGRGTQIVERAEDAGLDFLVSTEHAEDFLRDDAGQVLASLRRRHPAILVLAGIEWNVPGADHASVIVETSPDEAPHLQEFARRFDRKVSPELRSQDPVPPSAPEGHDETDNEQDDTWGSLAQAEQGLRWLTRRESENGPRTVVYLNHPGRRYTPDLAGFRRLFAAGLDGIAAAPGHQRDLTAQGGYTIDRHEPMVERIGGEYDALLSAGVSAGIAASSDYHSARTSFPPGEFSRTLVYCPERSPAGILAGLDAAATATVLGGIVTAVETRTSAPALDDAALVGEVLTVPVGSRVFYSVLLEVPALDFQGQPNRIDRVEIISDFSGTPRPVAMAENVDLGAVRLDFATSPEATARPGMFYLRARGRRSIGGPTGDPANADYLFHVGPTWVRVE